MELDPYSFAPKYPEQAREFFRGGRVRAWPEHPRSFSVEDLAELEGLYRRNHYLRSNEEYKESGIVIEVEGEYRLCPWLEWTEDAELEEGVERLFAELFLVHEPFSYELLYIRGSLEQLKYPVLRADFLIGRETVRQDDEEIRKIEDFYEELRREYTSGPKVPASSIAALTALRDAFEAQVRRYAAYAAETHASLQNVLRVVAVETARRVQATEPKLGEEDDRQSLWNLLPGSMRFDFRQTWRRVQWGYPLESMLGEHNVLPLEKLLRNARPPLLGVAARQGMVFHLSRRDAILKDALPLDHKRNVLEWLLYVALNGGEVPEWKTVAESLNRTAPVYEDEAPVFNSKKFRVDAKWLPYGRFIINRNDELLAQGITNAEERARQIGLTLHERFKTAWMRGSGASGGALPCSSI